MNLSVTNNPKDVGCLGLSLCSWMIHFCFRSLLLSRMLYYTNSLPLLYATSLGFAGTQFFAFSLEKKMLKIRNIVKFWKQLPSIPVCIDISFVLLSSTSVMNMNFMLGGWDGGAVVEIHSYSPGFITWWRVLISCIVLFPLGYPLQPIGRFIFTLQCVVLPHEFMKMTQC